MLIKHENLFKLNIIFFMSTNSRVFKNVHLESQSNKPENFHTRSFYYAENKN